MYFDVAHIDVMLFQGGVHNCESSHSLTIICLVYYVVSTVSSKLDLRKSKTVAVCQNNSTSRQVAANL